MQNFNNRSLYSRKKLIIIMGVVLFIITSPLPFIFSEKSSAAQLVNLLTIVALNLLVFAWCYYDSLERSQSFGAGWRLLVVLLGSLALIIYLFKSRGFKQGLIAIGKALLILLIMIIGSIIVTTITLIILKIGS